MGLALLGKLIQEELLNHCERAQCDLEGAWWN